MVAFTNCGDSLQGTTAALPETEPGDLGITPILGQDLLAGEWVQLAENVADKVGRVDFDGIDNDSLGNVFVTGYFTGNVSFGRPSPVPLLESVKFPQTNTYTKDAFLAKYSATGTLLFAYPLPSTGHEGNGYDLTVDKQGNAFISGAFSGRMDLSNTIQLNSSCAFGVATNNAGANGQLFLAKYDPLGNAVWAIQSDSQSNVAGGNEVSVDVDGNVLQISMIGAIPPSTKTEEIFGCPSMTSTSPKISLNQQLNLPYDGGVGGFDTFIAVYKNLDGSLLNGHKPLRIGGEGRQRGKAIDPSINFGIQKTFVFGADTTGPTTIHSSTGDDVISVQKDIPPPQEYSQNMVIGRATYDGQLLWRKAFGSVGFDEIKGTATDSKGNVVFAGTISGNTLGEILLDKQTLLPNATSAGFVIKLNPQDGSLIWARVFGADVFSEFCCEVVVDPQDNIYLSTRVQGGNFYFSNLSAPLAFSGNLAGNSQKGITIQVSSAGDLLSVRTVPHGNVQSRSAAGELAYFNGSLYTTPAFYGTLSTSPVLPSAESGEKETETVIRLTY